jgi:hypothetical protein
MGDALLLCLERCGFCRSLFALCQPCYRGHSYCDDDSVRPLARRRRSRLERGIKHRHSAVKITAIGIASCACANVQPLTRA